MEYVMLLWLSSQGPEIKVEVQNCAVANAWYVQALLWADRSGLPRSEVGFLCGEIDPPRLWRAHR